MVGNSPKMASQQQRESSVAKDATSVEDSKLPIIKQPEEAEASKDTAPPTNAPLAPPPKPAQNGAGDSSNNHNNNNGTEYGNAAQPNQTHLSKEPNPFENAFGNPAETPGKPTQLPGVTSLTSPASLLPTNTPGWPGSLRSGPLSPAMLTGPTNSNDYFNSDHHFSGSFPTPNESSLRTGLTPGGGGSMFPQPSPNSQALYNQLQSGGATPGTLDFHRTAMNARAHTQANTYNLPQNGATSQPMQNPNIQPDLDSKPYHPNNSNQEQHDNQDPFSNHQTNDAANGLFMLAQAGGQRNGQQGFAMPQPPAQNYHQQQQQQQSLQQQDIDANKRNNKNSTSTMSAASDPHQADYSDGSVEQKPQTRASRGKKGSAQSAKNTAATASTNGKRKSEETPSKPIANKRQRPSAAQLSDDDMEDDDEGSPEIQDANGDTRKMTDEEKRKNFLERNRVAALKCRQRKKQWLANLQQKVEIFSTENDALAATVTQLREEIVGLKTLLLAHKECPVSQAQGISSIAMQQIAGDNGQHYANPYGMGMGGLPQGQMQAQMQRR